MPESFQEDVTEFPRVMRSEFVWAAKTIPGQKSAQRSLAHAQDKAARPTTAFPHRGGSAKEHFTIEFGLMESFAALWKTCMNPWHDDARSCVTAGRA